MICLCIAGTSCIKDRVPPGADLGPGDTLPYFSIVMDDGTALSTTDLEGRVSVIMFFHTGCPDCRQELPVMQSILERFESESRVVICCISREEDGEAVGSYWSENSLTLPYSAQEDRQVYNLFATYGVPRVYISGPSLEIYSSYDDSPTATYEELESDILKCLEE